MHHRTALALALVVTVIVSGFAVSSGVARASPTAPPAAPHPGATDTIAAVANFGCATTFSTGYACGAVYFSAFDPSDTSAVVTILDPNATRDGLNTTVQKTWTVSFTAGPFNDSYTWNAYFELPLNLSYGGYWNITINGSAAGVAWQKFYVHTYMVSMTATEPVVIAQHHSSMLYFVDRTVNSAPVASLTSLTLTARYLTNTATWANLPGSPMTLPTAAWGNFSYAVPTDASTSGVIEFTLWANLSAGTYPNSETGTYSQGVGYVGNPTVTLGTCAIGCYSGSFVNGTPVYVDVSAMIFGPYADGPAVGLTATFEFDSGVTVVTPPGGYPKSVTTNGTGGAEILFIASNSVFTTKGTNSVKVTLTDPLNAGASYGPTTVTFSVTNQTPGVARLQVLLDSAQYFGGDTVTANWQLGGISSTVTQGWTTTAWWAWEDASNTFIASGMIGSTATSGSFSFKAPLNYSGTISVQVEANNATSSIGDTVTSVVSAPAILLNTPSLYYAPGDTVTVSVSTEGSIFANAVLYRTVVDSSGNVLQSGSFTGGDISVAIPSIGAPSRVTVNVAAQDPVNGIVGQASLTVYEGSGLIVSAGISTASNYIDGSFQPGQSISVHYVISAVGTEVLPKVFSVEVYEYGVSISHEGATIVTSQSSSGDVSFTIPSNTPAGSQLFEVFVVASSCYGGCYGATVFSVPVNPNPSVLSYQLGAGSGLTVGWLILLILILFVGFILFMMLRRRARPMVMKPSTGSGSSPPSGAGGSSGSGGSAQWQESSSSSGSSTPPLPTPPK